MKTTYSLGEGPCLRIFPTSALQPADFETIRRDFANIRFRHRKVFTPDCTKCRRDAGVSVMLYETRGGVRVPDVTTTRCLACGTVLYYEMEPPDPKR